MISRLAKFRKVIPEAGCCVMEKRMLTLKRMRKVERVGYKSIRARRFNNT